MNPSHQLPTTTPAKVVASNVHLHSPDETNNNIARSRSTNLHNSFHTRHREKNRKNKQQQSHYYIKNHHYPYSPTSSSYTPSIIDDQYQIEMSKTHRIKPVVTFSLILIAILNYI
jgi:hypothetical protein